MRDDALIQDIREIIQAEDKAHNCGLCYCPTCIAARERRLLDDLRLFYGTRSAVIQ